jgi:hypothetical protein
MMLTTGVDVAKQYFFITDAASKKLTCFFPEKLFSLIYNLVGSSHTHK